MFSIFDKLASISIKIKNIFSFDRVNSPNVSFGKGNSFLKQGIEIKPRSKGPYLLVESNKLESENKEEMFFSFNVVNLGSEPSNNTQTRTEIYIGEELKFKSPITASSVVPPDFYLNVLSQDPKELVVKCVHGYPQNKYIFIIEYTDNDENKFVTLKTLFFIPDKKNFSTREERVLRL